MACKTVTTTVLIISDTHCAPLDGSGVDGRFGPPPFKAPLPKADLLIHCGDLTMTGTMPQYHKTLDMLKEIDAPVKLVIAGNHDLSLDCDFVLGHTQKDDISQQQAHASIDEARALWTASNGRAKQEGVTYLQEGVHSLALPNGAQVTIYASPYTPEFCDWGFPYKKNEDRFNPLPRTLLDAKNVASHPVPSFTHAVTPMDILITHGPPYGRMDRTAGGDLAGCPHLLRALMRSRPLLHTFGHIHEGWGAERIGWSKDADEVTETVSGIAQWKNALWQAGVADHTDGKHVVPISVDSDAAQKEHAVHIDARDINRGMETLLVNASIMDVNYKPCNAPWLVDLELPKAELPSKA